jgi:hypothetical protein
VSLGELSDEFSGFPELGGRKFKYVLPVNNAKVYKAIGKVLEESEPKTVGEWAGFLGQAQRAAKKV